MSKHSSSGASSPPHDSIALTATAATVAESSDTESRPESPADDNYRPLNLHDRDCPDCGADIVTICQPDDDSEVYWFNCSAPNEDCTWGQGSEQFKSTSGRVSREEAIKQFDAATDQQAEATPEEEPLYDSLDASQDVVGKLIESQVTGLVECLREATQNGSDKPSASWVAAGITLEEATVVDNGDILDFTTQQDRNKFLSLGTTVKDYSKDHVVGEHGLGSATLMSMGALKVWSGNHILCIDYRDQFDEGPFSDIAGYRTVVVEVDDYLDGVLVQCRYYDDQVSLSNEYQLESKADELRKTLAFRPQRAGTDIYVNGESIDFGTPVEYIETAAENAPTARDSDPATVLTHEQEEGVIAVGSSVDNLGIVVEDQVDVFSNGIYVCSKDLENLSGVVVTSQNLSLPISRSSIKDTCTVWPAFKSEFRRLKKQLLEERRDSNLSEAGRGLVVKDLLKWPQSSRRDREVFKTVTGELVSYTTLVASPGVGFGERNDHAGTRLEEQTKYVVLDGSDLAVCRLESAHDSDQFPNGELPALEVIDPVEKAVEAGCIESADDANASALGTRQEDKRAFAQALLDKADIDLSAEYMADYDEDSDTPPAWTDNESVVVLSDSAIESQQWVVWTHEVLETIARQLAYGADTRRTDDTPLSYRKKVTEMVEEMTQGYRALLATATRESLRRAIADWHRDM
jgi:hypothetical protein